MSTKNTNVIAFLDNIGRIIIGKVAKETKDVLSVENPALVHIQPNTNTNQLQLQLLPLFFKELQTNKDGSTVWNFKQQNITIADTIDFNPQFIAQYEQVFGAPAAAQPDAKQQEVVKLFDDEESSEK